MVVIHAPGIEQCHVAELVDQTRNAVGGAVDHPRGRLGHFLAGSARCLQPVTDQFDHGVFVERQQVEAGRDPLGKLAQRRIEHHFAQFGLADEHKLDDLVLAGVDVGQHPKLFEAFGREVLRLVEDQHDAAARGVFVDQVVLELLEKLDVADIGVEGDAERVEHPLDQLAPSALRIRDEAHGDLVAELAQKLAQERRLAAADAAGDERDRCTAEDAELQHRIGAPVLRRPEQEIRVGHEREGTLAEPEEVHVEADAVPFVRCGLHNLVHPQSISRAAGGCSNPVRLGLVTPVRPGTHGANAHITSST